MIGEKGNTKVCRHWLVGEGGREGGREIQSRGCVVIHVHVSRLYIQCHVLIPRSHLEMIMESSTSIRNLLSPHWPRSFSDSRNSIPRSLE